MADAKFVCECDQSFRSACQGLEFYREVEGKKYCVLHCPVLDKLSKFVDELSRKLSSSEFDFSGVYFPNDVTFQRVDFKSPANFESATFTGDADFSYATFSGYVYFKAATFCGNASFIKAAFRDKAYFGSAIFRAETDFRFATFSAEASFESATLSAASSFRGAKIESYLRFDGTKEKPAFTKTALLDLQLIQISKPEQMIFHTVRLRPNWFVNVDSRKFEFTNIDWGNTTVRDELRAVENIENRHYLLYIAYRRLATNAEDNNQYIEASEFRYSAMDARRLEYKWSRASWWLDCCYWLLSGYGERIRRAFFALIVILLLFSVPYRFVGFAPTKFLDQDKCGLPIRASMKSENKAIQFIADTGTACIYSLETASLQKPEPRPTTFWARFFVGLETILAPLQAALLALAVRRRFMR